jgi:glutamyl-tRNA reductase
MKFYLAIVLLLLGSCSAEKHLAKAKKHIEIAKKKGAIVVPDTIWHHVYDTDTVWNYTNNTFETRQVVKDSFPYTITNTISSGMTRQERRHLDDMFKHMEKMMKLQNDSLKLALKYQTKQHRQNKKTDRLVTRRENRSNPWIWVILAALLVVAIYLIKQK